MGEWQRGAGSAVVVLLVLAACSPAGDAPDVPATSAPSSAAPSSAAPSSAAPSSAAPSSAAPSSAPVTPSPTPAPSAVPEAAPAPAAGPAPSDGSPRRATLTIPAIGLRDLVVVPYRGWTDDAPGTRIQDRGRAASPYGERGGTGPGGVGNYQVTAHRLSSTEAFRDLPELEDGDRVIVRAAGRRHVYEVRDTRRTSFRSERSLAEQRAAVPGRPGAAPTQAMITLSTCATPEDHAEGNFWSDEFKNPEHRIDKIGVLVRTT